ncbi:MAG: thiamine/thiamine pyrophosphate ABC transporter permease ThiP [Pseudomonadota bacterium]
MVVCTGGLRAIHIFGAFSIALILCLTLGPLAAVSSRVETGLRLAPADWSALRFTVTQAALSAFLSVVLAIPVARALARRRFVGRALLVTLLGAPFILPVIVAVLGLLSVFGQAGWLNTILGRIGVPPVAIYGLHGVVLAHVFLNLPLAIRLLLQGWLAIPGERFRLARALGFGPRDIAHHLERPMLREMVPGAFLLIFLICMTSFAVALTLGGGPRATTVELAIYQAFRFEFDLGKAAQLALVQALICGLAGVAVLRASVAQVTVAGLDRGVDWPFRHRGLWADRIWLSMAALFLCLPLLSVVLDGVARLFVLSPEVYRAALWSILVAAGSTALAGGLGLSLALFADRLRGGAAPRLVEGIGLLTLVVSPLVMGTGLFILMFAFVNPTDWALPVTVLVNAVIALPFVLRALIPAVTAIEAAHGRLADALGLAGWGRLRLVLLPRLRRPLGFALGLTAAFSMGDLGVIALFAMPEQGTLPLMVHRLMGAYRVDDAEAAALLLLILSLGAFWIFDRGGRAGADM